LEDYKRFLPEKSLIIEQAITVCQNSEIEHWKKPDFLKKPRKTVQDNLDIAKEISDKKTQANFFNAASYIARTEKNYRLSIEILDGIDKEFRNIPWVWSKIESTSKLIEESLNNNDFAEIENILESSPQEYRPFIIIRSLETIRQVKPGQKELILGLMNRARADFNKIELFTTDFPLNPTQFAELTRFYVKFGFNDEAIATHLESIKSFNRIFKTLPAKYKDKNFIPRISSYSRFTNQYPANDIDFINRYFDRIYENIGKIENFRIRLTERLGFLDRSLQKVQITRSSPAISNFAK
jgi:hypothetical protein